MHTIKVRVWDIKNKEMLVPNIHDGIFVTLDGKCGTVDYEKGKFEELDGIKMYFTGFYDLNEKKLFEGDICKDKDDNKFIIVWSNYYSTYFIVQDNGESSYDIEDILTLKCKKIGNIFENHDLANMKLEYLDFTKKVQKVLVELLKKEVN